jgi:hypothetical protein
VEETNMHSTYDPRRKTPGSLYASRLGYANRLGYASRPGYASRLRAANRALLPLLLALLTLGGGAVHAQTVGEVSLVLGRAYLKTGDQEQTIRAGTRIQVSDQIITEANGHVHIRFVDEALVSVRPDSLLEIQRYDYNPQSPSQSSIKLNLMEGITRSISGEGARAARERFRMNTPIAAIGVRGTDFVVSASGQSMRALVNEGAIVVAPFSSDCLADAFGPCSANAVELSQDSLQIVQFDNNTPLPVLMPATDERGPLGGEQGGEQVELASAEAPVEDRAGGSDVYLETVTPRRVAQVASAANQAAPPVVAPRPPVVSAPNFVPATALSTASLQSNNLVWGRWHGRDGQGAQERISVAYQDASAGRDITVLDSAYGYGLFRDGNGSTRVNPDLTVVGFALSSAQAFYHAETGVVAMQVNSGTLNINFEQNTFATQLGLHHSATGAVDVSAAGRLQGGGYFYNNTDAQRVVGAVSLDGKEAGYFFIKQLDAGSVQGLTLWDAQ